MSSVSYSGALRFVPNLLLARTMANRIMGRASIFRGKDDGVRIQGLITRRGGEYFELHRERLRKLYRRVMGQDPTTVSDADVIEYLSRGPVDTMQYLRDSKRRVN